MKKYIYILIIIILLITAIFVFFRIKEINKNNNTDTKQSNTIDEINPIFATKEELCKNKTFTEPLEEEIKYDEEIRSNEFVKYLRRSLDDYSNNEYIPCNDTCKFYGLYQGQHFEDSAYSTYFKTNIIDLEYLKSKFIVLQTDIAPGGGSSILILFKNRPDKVFYAWVYSNDGKYFDLRGFEEYFSDDLTRTDIENIQKVYINQICNEETGL